MEGQGDVLADGSDAGEVKQWQRRSKAERELAEAEEAWRRGDAGASLRLEAAEEAMEQLLDQLLVSPGRCVPNRSHILNVSPSRTSPPPSPNRSSTGPTSSIFAAS